MKKIFSDAICILSSALFSFAAFANDAITAFNLNNLEEAKALFLKQLAQPDSKNTALYYLANIEAIQGEFDSGLDYVESAIKAEPKSSKYYVLLGNIYGSKALNASIFSQLGLANKCLGAYEKAYEIDKNSSTTLEALVEFHRSAPSIAGGSKSKLEEYLAELQKINPDMAALKKIEIANQKGEDAMQQAKELSLKNKLSPEIIYSLARYFRSKKSNLEAANLYQQLVKMEITGNTPRDERWVMIDAYLQLGEVYLAENKSLDEGISLIEHYQKLNTDSNDIHYFWSFWSLAKLQKANNNHMAYQSLVTKIKSMNYKKNKGFAEEFERELKKSSAT